MSPNLVGIVIAVVAILSVFFGYGFGWFEWGRKLKAYQQAEKQPAQEPKAKDEPITTPPSAPLPPLPQEEPALLSLRQSDGRLRVELEGTDLEVETISVDQRKRLIEVVTRMRPWIEGRAAPTPPTPPAPVSVPQTLPSPQPTPTRPAPVPAKKEEAPQSMVAQIDEILQQRIVNTPLELIGLRLEETPGGGVTVIVGPNRYAGVGEVPDPEVQNALRTAIALWEKKFTPG